ncbi:hypothetical protein LY78DRAFT_494236 [Colletotrichum sublineola]|nr:hypothetical protein LY78DRAFT_494236 [Colletotrichum sublineola]
MPPPSPSSARAAMRVAGASPPSFLVVMLRFTALCPSSRPHPGFLPAVQCRQETTATLIDSPWLRLPRQPPSSSPHPPQLRTTPSVSRIGGGSSVHCAAMDWSESNVRLLQSACKLQASLAVLLNRKQTKAHSAQSKTMLLFLARVSPNPRQPIGPGLWGRTTGPGSRRRVYRISPIGHWSSCHCHRYRIHQ